MSFSDNIEAYISWPNINEWKAWQFGVITVEPIPTVKEYGEKMPEDDRLMFAKAVMRSIMYHKIRGLRR